ncbi:hypothetical protein NE865_03707 [Phthorimaea operculella]|nr:hypothetical protein NE865_03707 [Phthorimaea operculella]
MLGLVGAFEVSKQTEVTNQTPLSESESDTKHDVTSTPSDSVKENAQVINDNVNKGIKDTQASGQMEIIIEEIVKPNEFVPTENAFIPPNDFVQTENQFIPNDIEESPFIDNSFPLQTNIQDEMMETAEGFVPLPIPFRRRQQARRRFTRPNRRYFRKNPYRTPYYMYPYRSFYYPSSLRYYYY